MGVGAAWESRWVFYGRDGDSYGVPSQVREWASPSELAWRSGGVCACSASGVAASPLSPLSVVSAWVWDSGPASRSAVGVGGMAVVLSGVRPIVGVGVSAWAGALTPRTSDAEQEHAEGFRRQERADHWLEITRSAAVADQASAGCSAPNERIRTSTSSITESGVEAPAVMPIRSASSNQSLCKSAGRST